MILKKQTGKRVNGTTIRDLYWWWQVYLAHKNGLKALDYLKELGDCNPNRHSLLESGNRENNISPQHWIQQINKLFLRWHWISLEGKAWSTNPCFNVWWMIKRFIVLIYNTTLYWVIMSSTASLSSPAPTYFHCLENSLVYGKTPMQNKSEKRCWIIIIDGSLDTEHFSNLMTLLTSNIVGK